MPLAEGPALAILVIALSALVGAAMSALTAAMNALPEELLMALRDEGGPDAAVAARALQDRVAIRSRLLAGRVMSVSALATATAYLVVGRVPLWVGVIAVLVAALGYALVAEVGQTIARGRARVDGVRWLRWARPLELAFAPFGWPIEVVHRVTERIFPEDAQEVREAVAAREVEHIIERREEEGAIPEEYAQLLLRVLEFKDTVAREVMVPRTRMVALDMAMPIDEIVRRVIEEGHSRFPVYRERIDRIEGILHAKDLFRAMRDGTKLDVSSICRKPPLFVAESQRIGQVLREMQSKRVHLAVVVDEFGGTSGMVTLEDILEEIVGEIHDEHDIEEEKLVTEISPGTYLADARVSIHDLGQLLETPIAHEAEADSLGGLVLDLAGKVPDVGEQLELDGLELIVREADERHVTRVEIRRRTEAPAAPSPSAAPAKSTAPAKGAA